MIAFQSLGLMIEQDVVEEMVVAHVGWCIPFENDLRRRGNKVALVGQTLNPGQVFFAAVVVDPNDLEEIIALDQTVGGVVDGLAGPGQKPGRRIVVAQDEMSVGFIAL